MKKIRLIQGNQACAEGALAAGVRFFAGYPITPSTEIAEILARKLPQLGGKFIQMEDEIASMAAVIGASLAGKKAITATSGPGFSLMQENLGYACIAEAPCVVINVQRVGPSTGQPTAPAQGDVMQARWGTHGDHAIISLCPSSVREAFDLTVKAVNFAERFRTPVVLLLDEVIGHMRESVSLPTHEEIEVIDRVKPSVPPQEYRPYQPGPNGVPPMAAFGEGYRFHVTGLIHDERGFPTGSNQATAALIRRLHRKIYDYMDEIALFEQIELEDAEIVILAYGCTARSARQAVKLARRQGMKVGMVKLITLWPFPAHEVAKIAGKVKAMIMPEMNMGQLVRELEWAVRGKTQVVPLNRVDGELITPEEILATVRKVAQTKVVE